MAQIRCKCGKPVRDDNDWNSKVSYIYSMEDKDGIWDLSISKDDADDTLMEYLSEHQKEVWECLNCGVLWIEQDNGAYKPYENIKPK